MILVHDELQGVPVLDLLALQESQWKIQIEDVRHGALINGLEFPDLVVGKLALEVGAEDLLDHGQIVDLYLVQAFLEHFHIVVPLGDELLRVLESDLLVPEPQLGEQDLVDLLEIFVDILELLVVERYIIVFLDLHLVVALKPNEPQLQNVQLRLEISYFSL